MTWFIRNFSIHITWLPTLNMHLSLGEGGGGGGVDKEKGDVSK